jgi:hypothetical protein
MILPGELTNFIHLHTMPLKSMVHLDFKDFTVMGLGTNPE